MIERIASRIIKELTTFYPIVALNGPRQSGKTTLVKSQFPDKLYVSLEDIHQREFAQSDPKRFLTQSKSGMIIDEIQNCPGLFSYLQGVVDKNDILGEFVITGSGQFGLMSGIAQSLAGRVGLVELLPLSIKELESQNLSLNEILHKGFYPRLYDKNIPANIWYEDYIRTYLERDVRNLINVKDLSVFQKFLSLCAARTGQLLNYSELSNTCGIDVKTVKAWLSVLEASYIIFLLKPHHKNFSKKLVKTTKLYFYDSGLLSHLLRLRFEDIEISQYRGHIFESMIISDLVKDIKNNRKNCDLYFWRDNKGVEVDLMYEVNQEIVSIEIKSGSTLNSSYFQSLKRYKKYAGMVNTKSFLIYGGEDFVLREGVESLSWRDAVKVINV